MKTILVPVDFSPVTGSVVRTACEMAAVSGQPLRLLHVLSLPTWFETYGLGPEVVGEVMRSSAQLALERLEDLAVDCRSRGVAVETALPAGKPSGVILEHTQAGDVSHIVMGSHGHGPVFELLTGSTTQGVLRRAACPVLIVPAQPAALRAAPPATLAAAE